MKALKKKFNDCTIRKKLIILLCVVGFIPVILLSVSISVDAYRSVRENKLMDMENSMKLACASVNNQVTLCEQMIQYFVYDQNLIHFLECSPEEKSDRYGYYQELRESISALQYQNLAIQSVTIYSEGIQHSFGAETKPLDEMKKEAWYTEDMKNGTWKVDDDTHELVAIYKIPSYSGLESYAVARTNMDLMFQSLDQLETGESSVVVYGNSEIWSKGFDGTEETTQILPGKEEQQSVKQQEHTEQSSVKQQENTDYSFVKQSKNTDTADGDSRALWGESRADRGIQIEGKIIDLGLKVVYSQPRSAIQVISWKMLVGIVVQIGLCFLIIVFLGRRLADYISRPIELLTAEIQTVDEDRLTPDITSDRKDETGILIRSYHHMMKRIEELIQENYKTRIAQKEFEMKALQAQINPHFLYNSLSIINWKAIEAGEGEISQITLELASFYRTTLNKGKTMISIRMALENIRAYLHLQLWMHDDDFQVHYEIDEDTYEYMIPSLIFQPFVENALEHGLDIKDDPDHQLWICVSQDETAVYVKIRDNGVGMDAGTLEHILEYQAKGYGVKNVNDRMILHYGPEYGVKMESEPDVGTAAILTFPKKNDEKGGQTE